MFGLAHISHTMWVSAAGRFSRYYAKRLFMEPASAAEAPWRLPKVVPSVVGLGAMAWVYDGVRHVEPELQMSVLLSPEKPRDEPSVFSRAWTWCFGRCRETMIDEVQLEWVVRNPLWFHKMGVETSEIGVILVRSGVTEEDVMRFKQAQGKTDRRGGNDTVVYVREAFASYDAKQRSILPTLPSKHAGTRGSQVLFFKSVPVGNGVASAFVAYEYSKFRVPSWSDAQVVYGKFRSELKKLKEGKLEYKELEELKALEKRLRDKDKQFSTHGDDNVFVGANLENKARLKAVEAAKTKLETELAAGELHYVQLRRLLFESWSTLFWGTEQRHQLFALPLCKRGEMIKLDAWGGAANAPAILASITAAATGTS